MRHKFRREFVLMLALAIGYSVPLGESNADVIVYTDSTAFADALIANDFPSQAVTFETDPAGTTANSPATFDAITFENFGPPDLIVANDFATTSGSQYLGMSSTGFSNQFIGGFEIDMQFANSRAIGFFVITGEIPGFSIFDNDIQIVVPGAGTVALDVDDLQATIGGTDSVFFVGLIDTMQTFSTAQIRYDVLATNAITFNIDDIVTAIDPLIGDVNRDGVVNLLDVQPFIDLLATGKYQIEADIDGNGFVNLLDVEPFVNLLGGG